MCRKGADSKKLLLKVNEYPRRHRNQIDMSQKRPAFKLLCWIQEKN